jgi:lipopolysaccharide biosynthesis glycosyltransferase
MLVNVEAWVANDIAEQCRAFLTERPEYVRLADQDALNVVVADQWRRLPLEWNVVPISAYIKGNEDAYRAGDILPLDDALALEERARILHFAGPFKPWNPAFPPGPVLDRYRSYEMALREVQGRA